MIYISFVLLVVAIASFYIKVEGEECPPVLRGVLFSAFGLTFLMSVMTVVDTEHAGVVKLFGTVDEEQHALDEGIHFVNPFCDVIEMNCQTNTFELLDGNAVVGKSAEGMAMSIEGTVQHRLVPSEAPFIYKKFGESYIERLIYPGTRSAIRSATTKQGAILQMTKGRDDLGLAINSSLESEITSIIHKQYPDYEGSPFVLRFTLRDVSAPESVNDSINMKLQQEQEAEREIHRINKERQTKTWELEREELEAQRKAVEAKGIAEFQRIVTQGINDRLIHWKYIDAVSKLAESNNTTFMLLPNGASHPFQFALTEKTLLPDKGDE